MIVLIKVSFNNQVGYQQEVNKIEQARTEKHAQVSLIKRLILTRVVRQVVL